MIGLKKHYDPQHNVIIMSNLPPSYIVLTNTIAHAVAQQLQYLNLKL